MVVTREPWLRSASGALATIIDVATGPAIDIPRSAVRIQGFTLELGQIGNPHAILVSIVA